MLCTPSCNIFNTLLSTGFKSCDFGDHSWGRINSGVSVSDNAIVARAWWAFQVSQGSVETLFRWGGKRLCHVAANLFRKLYDKFHHKLPKFCRRYYRKHFGLFFRTRCISVLPHKFTWPQIVTWHACCSRCMWTYHTYLPDVLTTGRTILVALCNLKFGGPWLPRNTIRADLKLSWVDVIINHASCNHEQPGTRTQILVRWLCTAAEIKFSLNIGVSFLVNALFLSTVWSS